MDARLVGLVVVIGLLVGSLPVGIAVATASGPSHPSSTLETDRGASMQPAVQTPAATHAAWPDSSISDTLEYRTELRQLPDQPGEFEAEFQFAIPESVTKLEIDLESGATVEGADGFEETDDGRYRWTETSESPTIRTTLSANRSADGGHHAPAHTHAHDVGADSAGDETGYAFLETGEWGVVQVPHLGLSFQRTEPVGLEKSAVVDGPGATGGDIAFFGPVTEHERSTAGETIRLAVPEAATLDEDPADVLEALTGGSETLEIGARNDETFMVAVPADADFGPEGVQYGQLTPGLVPTHRCLNRDPSGFTSTSIPDRSTRTRPTERQPKRPGSSKARPSTKPPDSASRRGYSSLMRSVGSSLAASARPMRMAYSPIRRRGPTTERITSRVASSMATSTARYGRQLMATAR